MSDYVKRLRLNRALWGLSLAFFVALVFVLSGKAQGSRPQPVTSVRLYVFDLGARPAPEGRGGEAVPTVSPAYLIVHPKGTMMWEAGALPDTYVGSKQSRLNIRDNIRFWQNEVTLKSRLAEIGYKASDITYLGLSHFHDDHTANANDFAASTWLVQRDEHAVMFGDMASPNELSFRIADFRTYWALKKAKAVLIPQKDYDVFGDGTVEIVYTPANTPGGQALFVKLAKTGPIVLSGDLYHGYSEHEPPFTKGMIGTNTEADNKMTVASRIRLEEYMKEHSAKLWIQHDYPFYMTLKKSPEYYE